MTGRYGEPPQMTRDEYEGIRGERWVLPGLRTLLDDPRTRGAAENAIEDIAIFTREGG